MSDLVERLRDEAITLHGIGIDRGSVDASISGMLADEAASEIERLRAAIAYVLDGYGLNAPDFKRQPEDDEDDWIVEHLRSTLSPEQTPIKT